MPDFELSVVEVLLELCQQGSGGELIRQQIIDGLTDLDDRDDLRARSLVLWIAMLELYDGRPQAIDEVERAIRFWSTQRPTESALLPALHIVGMTSHLPPLMIVVEPEDGELGEDLGNEDLRQVTRRQILSEAFPLVPDIEVIQAAEVFLGATQKRWVRVDCTAVSRSGLSFEALILIWDTCLKAGASSAEQHQPGPRDVDVAIRAVECFVVQAGTVSMFDALRYLDEVVPSFSADARAVLAFQLAYRVARHIDRIDVSALQGLGEIGTLGVLEAIGSSTLVEMDDQHRKAEAVSWIVGRCLDGATSGDIDDYVIIAYDICMKYRNRDGFPRSAAQPMFDFGVEHGLEPVAEYFHGGGDVAEVTFERLPRELLGRWRAIRSGLLDLERSTPREHRRERVSVATEERSR
jgi:hypothetical protein